MLTADIEENVGSTKEMEDVVIFVIHGMGQQTQKFIQNIANLKKSADQLFPDDQNRYHFVGIEWHVALHSLETVDKRMQLVTLPTIPLMRIINNDYIGDTFYYFTKFHGKAISDICVDRMNEEYEKLKEGLVNFRGKVAIMGHSLGGLIAYDILCHQQWMYDDRVIAKPYNATGKSFPNLDGHEGIPYEFKKLVFKPCHLFTMGSPIAAVMIMRGQCYSSYHLPPCIKLSNIFHPYDPIAYRVEPLIDERYAAMEPHVLHHWNNNKLHLARLKEEYILPLLPDFSNFNASLYFPNFPDMAKEVVSRLSTYRSTASIDECENSELASYTSVKRKRMKYAKIEDDEETGDTVTVEQPSLKGSLHKNKFDSLLELTSYFASQIAKSFGDAVKFAQSVGSLNEETSDTPELVEELSDEANLSDVADEADHVEQVQDVITHKRKREDLDANPPDLPRRLDYVLQINMLENISHEYLTGLPAHFSYWTHKDLIYYVVTSLNE